VFPFSRTMRRRSVIVNLDGRAFRGILWARRGPLLVLSDAELLEAGEKIPVDGEVVVERSRVEWVQVLP